MTKKLPVLNEHSHAASTAFAVAEIRNPSDPGRVLYVDGNGKIARDEGTYAAPRPNAFSLLQVDDCPGSTPTCRAGCYVHNLEAAAKVTHDRYRSNSTTIREILAGVSDETGQHDERQADSWARALAEWMIENVRSFRWHVSGDVFSRDYARWVRFVIALTQPHVSHWIYTRSFDLARYALADVPGLSLNLSCDVDNYREAVDTLRWINWTPLPEKYPRESAPARLAYYTRDGRVPDDLPPDSIIFPDYSLRGAKGASPTAQRASSAWWQGLTGEQRRMVCAVDFYGTSEQRRCGPCSRCL